MIEKDKIPYHFRYGIDKDAGVIVLEENSEIHDKIITQYIDTKERLIRDCLIKLGWTPPSDTK